MRMMLLHQLCLGVFSVGAQVSSRPTVTVKHTYCIQVDTRYLTNGVKHAYTTSLSMILLHVP